MKLPFWAILALTLAGCVINAPPPVAINRCEIIVGNNISYPNLSPAQCDAERARQQAVYDAQVKQQQAQQAIQARQQGVPVATLQAADRDKAAGYKPESLIDFQLDGRDLARWGSRVSFTGYYVQIKNSEYVSDRLDTLETSVDPYDTDRFISIDTSRATRAFRKELLGCIEDRSIIADTSHKSKTAGSIRGGCREVMLGHVQMCDQLWTDNSSRRKQESEIEVPCLVIEDGRPATD